MMACKHSDYIAAVAYSDADARISICKYAEIISGTNFVTVNCTKPNDPLAPDKPPYCGYKERYYVDQTGRSFVSLANALKANNITLAIKEV